MTASNVGHARRWAWAGAALGALAAGLACVPAAWLAGLQRESARVHSLTGLPLSPHYGASKLRWCLDYVGAVR